MSATNRNENGVEERPTRKDIEETASFLKKQTSDRPKLAIICGSGLGGLADIVEDRINIPYKDVPGFPVSTVAGHTGQLVFGKLSGKSVVLMQGRAHVYEGVPIWKVAIPIRVLQVFGVKTIFVTNAAGGINRDFSVGDIMVISDHVNIAGFAGANPLVGLNDDSFGPRFPAMSDAYDPDLMQLAKKVGHELGLDSILRQGVYSFLVGPSFETIAECRLLKTLGVDATGMSTVPEVVTARHCGMRVFGLSLITNKCVMEYNMREKANHEEVLETGKKRAKDLQNLVSKMVASIDGI
ncbi:purine nucleoside phosphorylase-like [Liolophura sinensis]|uniref:purine nucleoside phosphorylase-like n=1 Tax=Liolophura sinensis TaxID=3198878 RepID=UPI003158CEAD